MGLRENPTSRSEALSEYGVHHRLEIDSGHRGFHGSHTFRNEKTTAAPFDGRNQLRRELGFPERQTFKREMQRTYPFIALRHEGNPRFTAYGQPPSCHCCSTEHLPILGFGIRPVITFANFLIFRRTAFRYLCGQGFYHGYLLGSSKLYKIVESGTQNPALLPFAF